MNAIDFAAAISAAGAGGPGYSRRCLTVKETAGQPTALPWMACEPQGISTGEVVRESVLALSNMRGVANEQPPLRERLASWRWKLPTASWADFLGLVWPSRNPYDVSQKSASKIGSIISLGTIWATTKTFLPQSSNLCPRSLPRQRRDYLCWRAQAARQT